MAHLFQRGKYIWLSFYEDGKEKRKSMAPLRTDVKSHWNIAKQKLKEYEARKTLNSDFRKVSPKKPELTFSEAFDLFAFEKKFLQQSSIELYDYALRNLSDLFGDMLLKEFTQTHAIKLVEYLKKSKKRATPEIYLRHIRIFFSWCVEAGHVDKNPIPPNRKLNIKKHEKEVVEIPSEHMKQLLNHFYDNDLEQFRFIRFLQLTALRISDALKVSWNDIYFDLNYIMVKIQKTGKYHKIPLHEELKNFLFEFRKDEGKLFSYKNRHTVKFWYRAQNTLKLPHYTFHQIRKTTITELINSGLDFETVHAFAGHSDPKTTWKHYRAERVRQQAKAISDKMNFEIGSNTPPISHTMKF